MHKQEDYIMKTKLDIQRSVLSLACDNNCIDVNEPALDLALTLITADKYIECAVSKSDFSIIDFNDEDLALDDDCVLVFDDSTIIEAQLAKYHRLFKVTTINNITMIKLTSEIVEEYTSIKESL